MRRAEVETARATVGVPPAPNCAAWASAMPAAAMPPVPVREIRACDMTIGRADDNMDDPYGWLEPNERSG